VSTATKRIAAVTSALIAAPLSYGAGFFLLAVLMNPVPFAGAPSAIMVAALVIAAAVVLARTPEFESTLLSRWFIPPYILTFSLVSLLTIWFSKDLSSLNAWDN
jgi:hypothetical protein